MATNKIEGISQLRDDLLTLYVEARNGEVEPRDVSHMSQLAGKIINSAKVQLQYQMHLERQDEIPFLEQ